MHFNSATPYVRRWPKRRAARVPCGPQIPSTIPAVEAALVAAQADVVAARKPLSGAYSPKAWAFHQRAIADAETLVSRLTLQLEHLRGSQA